MATTVLDTRTGEARTGFTRPLMPFISWGAILGGLAAGMATFFLLALLGIATGLTAIDPQATNPAGGVPTFAGIWTAFTILAAGFVGAYTAARMSGMSRRTDGLLHGFVTWGVSTLFLFYLATTGISSLLGGTFTVLGQGMQTAAGAVDGSQQQALEIITGSPGVQISDEALQNLQQQLQAGNRVEAINIMVGQMGFTQDRAELIVDEGIALMGTAQQVEGQEVAATAVAGLTSASWFLFAGVLLSLALSLGGGFLGAKAIMTRRTPLPERTAKNR